MIGRVRRVIFHLRSKERVGGDPYMEMLSNEAGGHSLQWSLKAGITILVHVFNTILFLSQSL